MENFINTRLRYILQGRERVEERVAEIRKRLRRERIVLHVFEKSRTEVRPDNEPDERREIIDDEISQQRKRLSEIRRELEQEMMVLSDCDREKQIYENALTTIAPKYKKKVAFVSAGGMYRKYQLVETDPFLHYNDIVEIKEEKEEEEEK